MDICVICNSSVETESAAVLEMGAYGNPKYLCGECAADLDEATLSPNVEEIASAIARLAKKVSDSDPSDRTFMTVNKILENAAERAKKIKEGSYDFSLDTVNEEEGFDEIPEELKETEEDIELDKQDEERAEKFNEVFDYVALVVAIAILGFVIWKIIDNFILK